MAEPRIIKKYPNRRLYDTELSRYITLADIRDHVMQRVEFRVVDANSGDDITRNILLQIIMEQESGGRPLFTTEVLGQMIRFYGDSLQGLFTRYLEQSFALFAEQQARAEEQIRETLGSDPIAAIRELTQRNLDVWKDLQDSFFKGVGFTDKPQSGAEKNRDET